MAQDDDLSQERDDMITARAMLKRIDEAVRLAEGIGAERLAEILKQAKAVAWKHAQVERSAEIH